MVITSMAIWSCHFDGAWWIKCLKNLLHSGTTTDRTVFSRRLACLVRAFLPYIFFCSALASDRKHFASDCPVADLVWPHPYCPTYTNTHFVRTWESCSRAWHETHSGRPAEAVVKVIFRIVCWTTAFACNALCSYTNRPQCTVIYANKYCTLTTVIFIIEKV